MRIVCATHKNLEALVASGAFRQDLYYRLNVVSLHMPPLREMREDLGGLIMRLLNKHRIGNSSYRLSPKAQDALLHYSYRAISRELENLLERAVALTVGRFSSWKTCKSTMRIKRSENRPGGRAPHLMRWPIRSRRISLSAGAAAVASLSRGRRRIQDYLDEIERRIIEQALQQTRYNRTQAAKLLGISFRSMRYRMERLDIN